MLFIVKHLFPMAAFLLQEIGRKPSLSGVSPAADRGAASLIGKETSDSLYKAHGLKVMKPFK
jgi:hypothetical protein